MVEARSTIVTILFTDLENSTPLLEKLGDDEYEVLRRAHFRLLREAVAAHGGQEVKTIGDALMVVFPSAIDALGCAVAMQEAVHSHNQREAEGWRLQMRVGLHAGEPIRDERDYSGKSVVVADRLCGSAHGSQIIASELVRALVGSRGGYTFRDLGSLALKGIADAVRAFELVWGSAARQPARHEGAADEPTRLASAKPDTEAPAAGAFCTILVTDIEGFQSLIHRLGDARALEVMRTYRRIIHEAVQGHLGTEVSKSGDTFMASFSSATQALGCAMAMQRAFAEHNESAHEPIRARMGLNAGEPIEEEGELFGMAVLLAVMLASKAEIGEILAPDVVRQLVAGKDFLFSDTGDTALRGFEDPVRLYEVRWRE